MHVFSLGDSTQAYNGGDVTTYLTNIVWKGAMLGNANILINQHYSGLVSAWRMGLGNVKPPEEYTVPLASSISGTVNSYAGLFTSTELTILTGQTLVDLAPGVYHRAVSVAMYTAQSHPANRVGYDRWISMANGKELSARGVVRTWQNGITRPWLALQVTRDYGARTARSAFMSAVEPTSDYKTVEITLPASNNDPSGAGVVVDWYCASGDTTPDINKSVSLLPVVVTTPGPGKIIYSIGIGGWCIEGFLNPSIVGADQWSKLIPLYVGMDSALFWIDIGTNGPYFTTQSDFEEKYVRLIELCRRAIPGAPIMLTTSHPTQGQSLSEPAYYVSAAKSVAARVPGVVCVDTWSKSPDYPSAIAEGDMADAVHYNAQGMRKWMERLNEVIVN